jgi:uncharacterized membrane protein
MTDQPPPSPEGSFFQQRPSSAEPVFTRDRDEAMLPLVIYILYLIPIGVTHIVGLVMAYLSRDTAPEWLRSHYTFQIRTIWIGLLYCIVAGLLCFVLVGFLLFPVVAIWFIVRCALGLVRLSQREPYPNPYSWTI